MGEVLEIGGFEIRRIEVEIERLRAKVEETTRLDGGFDYHDLAGAGLEVAQDTLAAMR